jgi:hypothetical protein
MKQKLIQVAEDCPVSCGTVPTTKREHETIPMIQYNELLTRPYYCSEKEFQEQVHLARRGKNKGEVNLGRYDIRRNALSKKYGWGVHVNEEGKLALVGCETEKYKQLTKDVLVDKVKAYRSKKV